MAVNDKRALEPVLLHGTSLESEVKAACDGAQKAGVSFFTLLSLLIKFGPQIWKLIQTVLAALQKPGGVNWQDITALIASEGQAAYEIVVEIAAALGITLPGSVVAPA